MKCKSLLVLLTLGVLAGCAAEASTSPATNPTPGHSFGGWVPSPGPELSAYADCLRQHDVAVIDVIGAFVLVPREVQADLTAAGSSCLESFDAFRATVESQGTSRTVPDFRAYTFIHQVRNCLMVRYQITLSDKETVILTGSDGITEEQFRSCVEEIRAYPTPTA